MAFDLEKYRLKPSPPKPPAEVRVEFTEAEWAVCESMAAMRVSPGWTPRFRNPNVDQIENDLIGVAGELAVGKYLGLEVGVEYPGYANAPDFEIDGTTIEVKSTKYRPPHLKLCSMEEFGSDVTIVVLVYTRSRFCLLWGWVTKGEFFERARTDNYGYGVRYVMRPPYRRIRELKKWIQHRV